MTLDCGERLKKLRQEAGLTQTALAEILGVTQTVISYNENSRSSAPNMDLIKKYSKYFDISEAELLGLEEATVAPEIEFINLLIDLTESNELKWDYLSDFLSEHPNDPKFYKLSGDIENSFVSVLKNNYVCILHISERDDEFMEDGQKIVLPQTLTLVLHTFNQMVVLPPEEKYSNEMIQLDYDDLDIENSLEKLYKTIKNPNKTKQRDIISSVIKDLKNE